MAKILIAVDGSELSLDAVRHGLRWLRQGLRARFVLANVQAQASLYEMVVVQDPEVLSHVREDAGTHLLQAASDLCEAAGARYECVVGTGDATAVLLELAQAHGCESIIIGARGSSALMGDSLGSTAQAVAHQAAIPVTVVKHLAPVPDNDEADSSPNG